MSSFLSVLLFVLLSVLSVVAATSEVRSLSTIGPFKVSDVTVSGISSGGYMAVQLHIAFSSLVNGSAIFAGGPYYCAENNLNYAQYKCMKTYQGLPNVLQLVTITNQAALLGNIDRTSHLRDDRVYLFSGSVDSVIYPEVVKSLRTYYEYFVRPQNIVADFDVRAEHCIPTLDYGESCATLSLPYIGKCDFDGAGAAFKTLFGSKITRVEAKKENLFTFDQRPFDRFPSVSSLDDKGYIYVPTACQSGTKACHLHFAFHGCLQNQDLIGSDFAVHAGFNEWAEANNVIVVYPYAKQSEYVPLNPNGCWDWWGYTGVYYAVKAGVQMQFFYDLYKALAK